MSSQGSSGVRAIFGAAFAPMSSDPLSREVSMPSASSIDSAPEVTSRLVDRGVMEPVQEDASIAHTPPDGYVTLSERYL